jgi:transcription elongation factor Elf1
MQGIYPKTKHRTFFCCPVCGAETQVITPAWLKLDTKKVPPKNSKAGKIQGTWKDPDANCIDLRETWG